MHISWTGKLCLKDYIQILIDISMVWAIDVNLASDKFSLPFTWADLQMGNLSVYLY